MGFLDSKRWGRCNQLNRLQMAVSRDYWAMCVSLLWLNDQYNPINGWVLVPVLITV